MREKAIILERTIQNDLATIAEIYTRIAAIQPDVDASEESLIVLAYHLHALYNAFENIFLQIAATFENNLDDQSGWHTQLLQRMTLDLTPIRPAVIDQEAYDPLDELRRFRHLFRHSYHIRLDANRLQLVQAKALALQAVYL
ncbi:MAG: antitoxin, partial [Anaerolineae bacterium]|nr:antitoxin [Anaerolineae bacterium]